MEGRWHKDKVLGDDTDEMEMLMQTFVNYTCGTRFNCLALANKSDKAGGCRTKVTRK